MKVTEEEVSIEETVEEVEYTYCDECGADCTDDYVVEPKELCRDCGADESKRVWTPEKYAEAFTSDDSPTLGGGDYLFSFLVSPLVLGIVLITLPSYIGESEDGMLWTSITLGAVSWTALIMFIMLI